jgi:YegS/Rv2252/BmrU family lipid kinase
MASPARGSTWRGQSTRARIIVNPTSGGGRGAALVRAGDALIASLAARGLAAEICPTTGPGSARRLAEQAVRQGFEMVVAAGGDGTINEVIQALVHHTTALGVLPLGTVNVWAREVGIPQGVAGACRVLVEGVRRRIDVGRANTRYFLLMAGIGIDAEITRRVERHWLKRVGLKMLGYIAAASYVGVTERPHRFTVRRGTQRRTAHAVQILIGNTRLWGGAIELAQRALADDGWLDVVFIGGHHLRHRVNVVVRAALHRRGLGPGTRYETVRTVHVEAAQPLAVQADGELIGHLPMTFAVMPRALTVVVPRDARDDLFIHPPLDD